MSALVIDEDGLEVKSYDLFPNPTSLPVYTYGYNVDTGSWCQVRYVTFGNSRGHTWMVLDPNDPAERVPAAVRAAALLMG